MRTITVEEHFMSPGFLAIPGREHTERLRGLLAEIKTFNESVNRADQPHKRVLSIQ
jgi:hypothetical protein